MTFEILCATMHQSDFSKIKQMNIKSNVVFANQCDHTSYEEMNFDGHTAKMISTDTRGVGKNRNLALIYASADICLLADDDVTYFDNIEEKILTEFETHLDADIIVFNFESNGKERKMQNYSKTQKWKSLRSPWGAIRIAFRLSSVRKSNIWFSTLFGGGCLFPSGEDSIWIKSARKAGLVVYVSSETLGCVSYETSTWFTGYDEKFYFSIGSFCQALHPKAFYIWVCYYLFRYREHVELCLNDKFKWMNYGKRGYCEMKGYSEYAPKFKRE